MGRKNGELFLHLGLLAGGAGGGGRGGGYQGLKGMVAGFANKFVNRHIFSPFVFSVFVPKPIWF